MTYITKNGITQKIVEDALPLWVADGWAVDQDRDGVADKQIMSAILAADLAIPATTAVDVVSISLVPGTWLISPTLTLLGPTAGTSHDVIVTLGTAAGTFAGPTAASITAPAANSINPINFDVFLVVTAAGTVKMRAFSGAGGGTAKAKGVANFTTLTATGLTAVKVG